MLLLTKRFLVVEGVHDKEVLNTLIGDQLRELDTHIFSMSGTGNIVTFADSELLYDLTDAAIIVVVDNSRIEKGPLFKIKPIDITVCTSPLRKE